MWSSTVVSLKINGNAYWELGARPPRQGGRVLAAAADRDLDHPRREGTTSARMSTAWATASSRFSLRMSSTSRTPTGERLRLSSLAIRLALMSISTCKREFHHCLFIANSGLLNIGAPGRAWSSARSFANASVSSAWRTRWLGQRARHRQRSGRATPRWAWTADWAWKKINRQTESKIWRLRLPPPSIIWTVLGHLVLVGPEQLEQGNQSRPVVDWSLA